MNNGNKEKHNDGLANISQQIITKLNILPVQVSSLANHKALKEFSVM